MTTDARTVPVTAPNTARCDAFDASGGIPNAAPNRVHFVDDTNVDHTLAYVSEIPAAATLQQAYDGGGVVGAGTGNRSSACRMTFRTNRR